MDHDVIAALVLFALAGILAAWGGISLSREIRSDNDKA